MPAHAGTDTRVRGSASIRKRGDCPRERAAGNGGGNRRQDGTKEPVSNVNFASAWAMASSTRCKRAALHELCWFDSNPMHQSMASVVQAGRTPECDSGGRGFEPRPSPQNSMTGSVAGSVRDPRFFPVGWAPGPARERSEHAPIAQLEESAGLRVRRFGVRILVGAPEPADVAKWPKASACRADISRVRIPSSAPSSRVQAGPLSPTFALRPW